MRSITKRSPSIARLISLLIFAALALTGCSGAGTTLIVLDEGHNDLCVPGETGTRRVVVGIDTVHVDGTSDLTVTDVTLVDPDNLELLAFEFGQWTDEGFAVASNKYDKDGPKASIGDVILLSNESYIIKVGVKANSTGGRAAAIRIHYAVKGRPHEQYVDTITSFRVPAVGEKCFNDTETGDTVGT